MDEAPRPLTPLYLKQEIETIQSCLESPHQEEQNRAISRMAALIEKIYWGLNIQDTESHAVSAAFFLLRADESLREGNHSEVLVFLEQALSTLSS